VPRAIHPAGRIGHKRTVAGARRYGAAGILAAAPGPSDLGTAEPIERAWRIRSEILNWYIQTGRHLVGVRRPWCVIGLGIRAEDYADTRCLTVARIDEVMQIEEVKARSTGNRF